MNDGLIRPLDDLVAKYGSNLNDNQKITIDGRFMLWLLWLTHNIYGTERVFLMI